MMLPAGSTALDIKQEEKDEATLLFESAMKLMDSDDHEGVGIEPMHYKRSPSEGPEEYTFEPVKPCRDTDLQRPDHLVGLRALAWRTHKDGSEPVSIVGIAPLTQSNLFGRTLEQIVLDPFHTNPDVKFTRFAENGTPIVTLEEIHSVSRPTGVGTLLSSFWHFRYPFDSDDEDGEEVDASTPDTEDEELYIPENSEEISRPDGGDDEDMHRIQRQFARTLRIQQDDADDAVDDDTDPDADAAEETDKQQEAEKIAEERSPSNLKLPELVYDGSSLASFDSSEPPSPPVDYSFSDFYTLSFEGPLQKVSVDNTTQSLLPVRLFPSVVQQAEPYNFSGIKEKLQNGSSSIPQPSLQVPSTRKRKKTAMGTTKQASGFPPNCPPLPTKEPWICPFSWCAFKFTTRWDLERHLKTNARHTADGFICSKCGEMLSRADALRRHEARNACGKRINTRKPVGPPVKIVLPQA